MGKHTPGPWRATPSVWTLDWVVEHTGADTTFRPLPVTESNARLIAAAPDLLAACIAALGYMDTVNDAATLQPYMQLEKAIEKAKRES